MAALNNSLDEGAAAELSSCLDGRSTSIDDMPSELLMEILSRLGWRQQLTVRRVSRRWKAAVDACMAIRKELHIDGMEVLFITDKNVQSLLQKMPALRSLFVVKMGHPPTEYKNCMPPAAVEQLFASSPQLQELGLTTMFELPGMKTLFNCLPDLRSLHLPDVWGDWMFMLPSGLQSLTLSSYVSLDAQGVQHLSRCTQLRELNLKWVKLDGDDLPGVLAACPQLEKLGVCIRSLPTSDWAAEVTHVPQLRELDISCFSWSGAKALDLSAMIAACCRLERLKIDGFERPLSTLRTAMPSLTHLELRGTETDDATLLQLGDVMPSIRHLSFGSWFKTPPLTELGLATGLERFKCLQVLDLRGLLTLNTSNAVLFSLGEVRLKALAFKDSKERKNEAFQVIKWLRLYPSLAVVYPGSLTPDQLKCIANTLQRHGLPEHRDITLIVGDKSVYLSRNMRVVRDRDHVWEKLTGWWQPRLR